MADPLSVTASLLAVTTAAIQSTKSLYETIKRFKDRNRTLRRLQDQLADLIDILNSLAQVIDAEQSMLTLLKGPVERCSQLCREFEQLLETFKGKSKTGLRDWAKLEFMRGDMNEFIDTIAGYKSTISVGLGTITMHTSKVSQNVLQEYNEMIQNTTDDLRLHLQQIDEKMTQLKVENTNPSGRSIDLENEREVTKQCLRVCEDARSYIESLSNNESSLLPEVSQNAAGNYSFDAQLRTRQVLEDNRESLARTISHLQTRLEVLVQNDNPDKDNERMRLQADLDISRQCLNVCKVASEVSRQKIYRIGEVIADDDSDQVVVTTLADLFDVKKALSRNSSAQLVGSMTEENLRYLTEKRYDSRFGALAGTSNAAEAATSSSPAVVGIQKSKHASAPQVKPSPEQRRRQNKPSPNEMRKRDENADDG